MFELAGYHIVLAAFGLAVILAYWLPRFVSGREPAASALLIGLGFLVFGWVPGMPQAIDPIALPKPWEVVSELCVVIGLFGVGLRAYGDIFAGGHRHGARDQARDSGDQNIVFGNPGSRDAGNQTGRRDNAVVGA